MLVKAIKRIPDHVIRAVPSRWKVAMATATQNLRRHAPILIYQMGKVGSTTLYETLRAADLPNPIFHVHYLVAENIQRCESTYRRRGMGDTPRSLHLTVGRVLRWRIRFAHDVRWKIITGVRDPVRRAISRLFQAVTWKRPELCRNGRIQTGRVLDFLDRKIRPGSVPIQNAYTWFDRELKPTFGVDLYAHPFGRARGYQRVQKGNADLLVYRLEDMDCVLDEGLSRFLGADGIEGKPANRAVEKKYSATYREVLNAFEVEEERCRRIYDDKYIDHFYGPAMKEAFVRRWSG